MKHVGIIAEYNPFHKGHEYQILKIKKLYPEKNIVIALSGDYVQRGEPAVFPKSVRTKCALIGGADIIIGMPSLYSSASSEHFACAGVNILYKTGIIDTLCFGAECDDINVLSELADIFLYEPENYQKYLKTFLSEGMSFPKARANAIKNAYPEKKYEDVLQYPNNILAIDYIKAIRKYNIPITPFVIKRSHNNHNSIDTDNVICSSTAIRKALSKNDTINSLLPANVSELINDDPCALPIFSDDFLSFLQSRLIEEKGALSQYYEVSEELCNTINRLSILPSSFDSLIDSLSGKHTTNARIRRALLNVMLSRSKELMNEHSADKVEYIRLSGFKESASKLIKTMQETCTVPVINKPANAYKVLSSSGKALFDREVYENSIYRQMFYNKYGIILKNEYEQSVIIV